MAFFSSFIPLKTTHRHLPHWEQPSSIYFVTFRLADSIPSSAIAEMQAKKRLWELRHPGPLTPREQDEYHHAFTRPIHHWLDQGLGSCLLHNPDCSSIVATAITFFDHQRYHLDEWVIMPNHVHILLHTIAPWDLPTILHSWKSYSSHQINKHLQTTGSIWQDETYDHLIRSQEELDRVRRYIKANPKKARIKIHHASFTHHTA